MLGKKYFRKHLKPCIMHFGYFLEIGPPPNTPLTNSMFVPVSPEVKNIL